MGDHNTREIPLTQGKITLVDAEDFEWLSQWRWQYDKGYARRSGYIPLGNGKYKRPYISMHREIWTRHNGLIPKGFEIDHKGGEPWDNRKSNLRLCTHSENGKNQKKPKNNTTGYKNVHKRPDADKNPRKKPYQVIIFCNGKLYSYKCYYDLLNAALAANEAAIKHFGKFACLNELPPNYKHRPELEIVKYSKTGVKGVCQSRSGKYKAYINRVHLGTFEKLEEAIKARADAEKTLSL